MTRVLSWGFSGILGALLIALIIQHSTGKTPSQEQALTPSHAQSSSIDTTLPSTTTEPSSAVDTISAPAAVDTRPGTVLSFDAPWFKGSSEVVASDAEPHDYGGQSGEFGPINGALNFQLTFRNSGSSVISLGYYMYDAVRAFDNLGHKLRVEQVSQGLPGAVCDQDRQTRIVAANDHASLSCVDGFLAVVDLGNSAIKYVEVRVTAISSIRDARWRFPIAH